MSSLVRLAPMLKLAATLLMLSSAATLTFTSTARAQENDVDCSQLGASPEQVREQAQATLAQDPSDPNVLDFDGDGVACEISKAEFGAFVFEDGTGFVADAAAPPTQPAPTQATLPDTGGLPLLPVAVLLVVSGILGISAIRRLN